MLFQQWRVPGWDSSCRFFVLLLSFSDLGNVKTLDYLSRLALAQKWIQRFVICLLLPPL